MVYRIYNTGVKMNDNDKCDIIDIANEEMKRIDSSKIDIEIDSILKQEYFDRIIDTVFSGKCKKEHLKKYKQILNDKDILDIRASGKYLYIKTTKSIIPLILANIMMIEEKMIETVPIKGKYNFYMIDVCKWIDFIDKEDESNYFEANISELNSFLDFLLYMFAI